MFKIIATFILISFSLINCLNIKEKSDMKITKEQALKIADQEASKVIAEYNQSEAALNTGIFMIKENYRIEITSISIDNEECWFIYYFYNFPEDTQEIFTSHPEHFTIQINKKNGDVFLIHGE